MKTRSHSKVNRQIKEAKSLSELGSIVLNSAGKEACVEGYGIDADDPVEVGCQALLHGDINPDGTLN